MINFFGSKGASHESLNEALEALEEREKIKDEEEQREKDEI